MTTHILGISAFFHDSAATLLRDGEIVAAAQEERFSRDKADPRYPAEAVSYCLQEAEISPRDLDFVVFYERTFPKFDRLSETHRAYAPEGFEVARRALRRWSRQNLQIRERILADLDGFTGEFRQVDHHASHAASAFFPSPYETAAILTMDAVGEWATSATGRGRGNRAELMEELRFPHSLGMLYSAFTHYTGFKVNSGEYKLMGLAPYGVPRYTDVILDTLVELADDGSLWLDMDYFNYCQGLTMTSGQFHDLFGGAPRKPDEKITEKDMDLAASVQAVAEEAVLRAAGHVHELTGEENLVMAGGVALNCVANGRLLREGPFDSIWVQPAAGDAGGSLGAALLVWHHELDNQRGPLPEEGDRQRASLLGPAFGDDDIRLFLDSVGAVYHPVPDEQELVDTVAGYLDDELVVGWFQGRMEFGPRALGCRSIIGDARSSKMQSTMNLKIKFRESFRPFAPCVLQEYASEVFEMEPGEESPYMLIVAPVREDWRIPLEPADEERMRDPDLRVRVSVPRSRVPAITHVDYSARVQTVDEKRHGRYYRMMRRFHELTGCPVIVNTSFNIRGEPIVCTPEDAFKCFMATEMDCLVLENTILLKDEQPEALRPDLDAYRAQFTLD